MVGFLEIENDIQLAHISIRLVHLFHISVNYLQSQQLIVVVVYPDHKEKRRISPVNNFAVFLLTILYSLLLTLIFDNVTHLGSS